ncbi:GerW family sporulation protein [Paenibacillus xerothermodurans]|uniref:Sporulation protein YtfJ n=1 Tax=Paenibacillus xerothermodurans TaxID=1977292 RepID=A0A2W1P4C6_PAEXE|nr:GerW family sporulation protein [Paenibacillus xerothermodurans]PZE21988.1 sporulation protein YtfJ [Paenibacillus xerothermodurans]
MTEHPIQGLMKTAMENIKEMVDVNTIVGDPVETPDGSVIMPISKVGFGFAAGGSEFGTEDTTGVATRTDAMNAKTALPFGGGSGGGVSITPIAFLVVGAQGVKIVPLDNQTHLFERLIDAAPNVVDKIQSMISGGMSSMGMMGATSAMGTTPPPATSTTGTTSATTPTTSSSQNFIV